MVGTKCELDGARRGVDSKMKKEKEKKGKKMKEKEMVNRTIMSDLFSMQVKELLMEVSVDYEKTKVIESVLHSLKATLEKMPEEMVDANIASAFVSGLGLQAPSGKIGFCFKPPQSVEVVGSFMLQTVVKPAQNVDLCIQIPKSCFLEKDFLNYRYHAKRAMYLAAIERYLQKEGSFKKIEWGLFRGDVCKPFLLLTPDATAKFVVRVLATISPDVFQLKKLVPGRNNVREVRDSSGNPGPTPHYSNSILEDMFMREHLSFIHLQTSSCPALREAIILLKVWLRQRGGQDSPDTFNGFLLTMLAAHLCTTAGNRRIVPQMSSNQIFRAIINFLASTDLTARGIFMAVDGFSLNAETAELKCSIKQAFAVVLCDPSGRLNLAARMTRGAMNELRQEAAITQKLLMEDSDHVFDSVFMTPVNFPSKFDYWVRLRTCSHENPADGSTSAVLSGDVHPSSSEETRIESLLTKALGERARMVRVKSRLTGTHSWSLKQGVLDCRRQPICVGILLGEGESALKQVDVGPSADNKDEVKKFRQFWGPKTELRRFQDGTIAETAVWECLVTERHLIIKRIVEHIVCCHVHIPVENIEVVAGQLDCVLWENGEDGALVMPTLLGAFNQLSKHLRALKDLPLAIVNVQPLSAVFRQSAVFPPKPHPLAHEGHRLCGAISEEGVDRVLEPLEVLLQLEGSGKWPDDPEAVKKTKAAICLKIAESLQEKHSIPVVAAEDAIDVLTGGFAFRLTVAYEREASLVNAGSLKIPSTPGEANGKPTIVRLENRKNTLSKSVLHGMHAGNLQGLQGQFPAYASSVRLAKRWVGCHMFSDALCEEAVELLVASVFSQPFPFSTPRSRICGLLRFLQLLSRHDWSRAPLIVDVNKSLRSEERRRIQVLFEAARVQARQNGGRGAPAMFIATPYDHESAMWTESKPSTEALRRLTAYAKSSAALLEKLINGEEQDPNRWKSLYRTPLSNFHALVLLNKEAPHVPDRVLFPAREAVQALLPPPPPEKRSKSEYPFRIIPRALIQKSALEVARQQLMIGFDPTTILMRELQAQFGDLATFWRDALGGDVIGITWAAKAFPPSSKLGSPSSQICAVPAKHAKKEKGKKKRKAVGAEEVIPDATTPIFKEMKLIGKGLIEIVTKAPLDSKKP